MDFAALDSLRELVWLWLVAPAVLLAGAVLTVRLGAPQLTRLRAAWRGLGAEDETTEGTMPPAAAAALSIAAAHGAAAALGAATAVALGGPGALPWVWLLAFFTAPLRVGEALLARTAPAGGAQQGVPGSLAARLVRDGGWRPVGWALVALVALSAFAFVGGVQGEALREVAAGLVPAGARYFVAGAALIAAGMGLAGPRRVGALAGYVVLVALVLVCGVALFAAFSRPDHVLSVFSRALGDVFSGAAQAGAWSGALVGEIARAALLYAVAPLAAGSGLTGALDAEARAASTRGQAATALFGPLVYALVSTLLVMATVATGAFSTPREETRSLSELRVYDVEFETVSQRLETERLRTGFFRVRAGELRDLSLRFGAERSMLLEPHFSYYGGPADVAAFVEGGVVKRLMRPDRMALGEIPVGQAQHVLVRGQTVPTGGSLLAVAASKALGGRVAAQLLLAALALLGAIAAGALALGVRVTFARVLGERAGLAAALLPAAGLALTAIGVVPWLAPVGAIVAGLTATLVALVLLVRSGELAKLWK
jgi:AGCS family alanine or glycine:cation symporter